MSLCTRCSNSALLQTRWEKLQPIGEEPKVVHSWITAEASPECTLCQLVENETSAVTPFKEQVFALESVSWRPSCFPKSSTDRLDRRFIEVFLEVMKLKGETPPMDDMTTMLEQDLARSEHGLHDGLDPKSSSTPIASPHESLGQDGPKCPVEGVPPSGYSDRGDNVAQHGNGNTKQIQLTLNMNQPISSDMPEGSLWEQCGHLLALKVNAMSFDQHVLNRTVASMLNILSQHGGSQDCVLCKSMKDLLASGKLDDVDRFMDNLEAATQSEKEMVVRNHMPPPDPHMQLEIEERSIERVEFVLEKREQWSAIRLQEFRRSEKTLRVGPRRTVPIWGWYLRDLTNRHRLLIEQRDNQSLWALSDLERSPEPAPETALMKEYGDHAEGVCVLVPVEKGKRCFAREVTECVDSGLIKLWLSRCEKNHSLCFQRNKDIHPPGLILIDAENMCLFPVAIGSFVRYIALSYVWGDVIQPTLRKAVLEMWTSDGQLRDMEFPQTIRDAIKLVRMIGYRYIWVDALCIVQDDAASRHGQISQMHEIYQQADLTIVAADGDDCSEGLPGVTFAKQRLRKHHRYDLPGLSFMMIPSSTKHRIEMSSWRTRGWTFQEELCSRRTLVLLPEVMFFSCASAVWREDLQLEGEDALPRSDEGLMSLASMLQGESTGRTKDYLVKKYMQRTLSRADDMENAFAGVAGILEPLIGPAYHGIPERMFTEGIRGCWFWDTSLQRRAGFPSWSWTGWIYRQEQADVGIQPLTTASSMRTPLAFYKVGHSGIDSLGPSRLAAHSGSEFLPRMDVELRSHFLPNEEDMKFKTQSLQNEEAISNGLIAFYTSIAYLRLRTPPGDIVGTSREYRVFHPQMNRQLTSIRLNVDFVAQKGTLLPFIVIDYDPDRRSFRLMLISTEGNIVERVNVTSQGRLVKEDDWKDANPKRKLVIMS